MSETVRPPQTQAQIVKTIDEIECDIYRLYGRIERLRLALQQQWRVKPSDADRERRPK